MAKNKAANWEKWVHGELVASLQAKGKLPKTHTVASDYKDKAYHNTAGRLFPLSADEAENITAVLLAEARQKLSTAQAQHHHQQVMQKLEMQQCQQVDMQKRSCSNGRSHKAELKARMAALQQELKQESSSCSSLEAAIAAAKNGGQKH